MKVKVRAINFYYIKAGLKYKGLCKREESHKPRMIGKCIIQPPHWEGTS